MRSAQLTLTERNVTRLSLTRGDTWQPHQLRPPSPPAAIPARRRRLRQRRAADSCPACSLHTAPRSRAGQSPSPLLGLAAVILFAYLDANNCSICVASKMSGV